SRDSIYWLQIRNLPLRSEEIVSYKKKDSLDIKFKQLSDSRDTSGGKSGSWFGKVVFGDRVDFGKKYRFEYGGLLQSVLKEYNFVDGVWLGQKLAFGVDFANKHSLTVSPSVHYVTAREAVNWQVTGTYGYAPLKNGRFIISGGNSTFDFDRIGGISRLVNSLFSLYAAQNSVKFYQKRYLEASNRIDAANGFFITANVGFEKRNSLENKMSYNFFGKEPSPNLPEGQLDPMPDNTLTRIALQLDYTPRYRYRIREGRKLYAYSKYPTFTFKYEKGIATDNSSASFDRAELGVRQEMEFNLFNKLEYSISTGTFLSSKRVYFPDFKHNSSNELFFTTNPLSNSFCMTNYSYSTDKSWIQMHLSYTSAYLFIKNLPFLQKYLFDESLYARTLWIPGVNYSEFGYSLGLFKAVEAGVFVGFKEARYEAVGFTLSMPLNF
ncbi:MAG: DUF5686 family protein, partial [Prevotellaceae bacterium]|nr:DUF5686 family protein [Prevotellaceae bacterium]